jgi:peptide/nickel transport system permease protein
MREVVGDATPLAGAETLAEDQRIHGGLSRRDVGEAPRRERGRRRGRRRRRDVVYGLAWAWLGIVAVAAIAAPWLPLDPDAQNLQDRLAPPFSPGHVLGTDGLGRDLLAQLVEGARVTLAISVSAVVIGMLAGGAIGVAAGFYRGPVEAVILWLANVILAFPGLVLLLGLVAFFGRSMSTIILVIGFLSVPTYARVARATTLAVAQREYVLAAYAMGASRRRIMWGEILPNVARPVAAFGLVALGVLIVLETSLAFLGLSVNQVSWGAIIGQGRQHMSTTTNPVLSASVVVFLTVLSVNFAGDELRRRFDVKESNL